MDTALRRAQRAWTNQESCDYQQPDVDLLLRLSQAYLRAGRLGNARVIGRLWWSKSLGRTYHAVDVFIDDLWVASSGVCSGYGTQYIQTAVELLEALGLPAVRRSGRLVAPITWFEKNGFKLNVSSEYIKRKKDL